MFDFEESDEQRSRWPRIAVLSGTFLAMVALTLAAMVAFGFLLIWTIRAIQD